MIKKILPVILLFVSCSAFAQLTVTIQWQPIKPGYAGDTIYYKPAQKLTWVDFKGRPDAASPAAAITESGFGYNMTMNSFNKKMNVVITIFCYFNKMKSWVKKDMNTDYALLHEQHHYDITYINTCLFIQKLRQASFTKENFNSLVEKIHDTCFNAMSKMQDDYDGETRNGRISSIQANWNKKVDLQLAALPTN